MALSDMMEAMNPARGKNNWTFLVSHLRGCLVKSFFPSEDLIGVDTAENDPREERIPVDSGRAVQSSLQI